ncbi:putative F-box domain-containing protein [Helianthus annuus]|nr:putative F-box domain-containing protein [Helianthus annuus]
MVHARVKTNKSGALIGSNDDLLTEILLRLPVTSILRFKSVSKHWRLLLSHTHFTHRYDKLSKSPGIFADNVYVPFDVENPSTPPPCRNLDTYFDRSGVRILQSCNGLLLCCTERGSIGQKAADKYYVFNPTTKQLALIPPIRGGLKVRKTIRCMGLAFHQTDCVHYKLVCIRELDTRGELFQIQIYSSDTRKWKISIESFPTWIASYSHGVYWNGAVYWAPAYGTFSPLYFKLDVEQLQTLPLPVQMNPSETRFGEMYFGESRGHLHLIVSKRDSLRLNVYEMLSDHSGWFIRYQLELDELPGAFPEINIFFDQYELQVIDVVRGEEEEDTFLVLVTPFKMITYKAHAKSFKEIFTLTNSFPFHFHDGYSRFHRYTETLASF